MHKSTSLWVALVVAAASLSSCSRANYAFNNQAASYASTEQPVAAATAPLVAPAAPTAYASAVGLASRAASPPVATQATRATRPTLVQRLAVKKLHKVLAKAMASPQNVAHTEKTASNAGRYGLFALIGAAILVIGGVADVGFLLTFGTVIFLISLVLMIIHLFKGD